MSWSIYRLHGKPAAVAAEVAKQLQNSKCSEPEESIKTLAGVIIAKSLEHFPPDQPVSITASGSQSVPTHEKPNEAVNQLLITIDPLWNFKE